MPTAVLHMPVENRDEHGWEATLAWLSRDQECRLLGPLDWRAPQTQSQSPTRALSAADRLVIVRLLLNALQAEEIAAADTSRNLGRAIGAAKERIKRLEWFKDDMGRGLSGTFGGDPVADPAAPDLWSQAAGAALAQEEQAFDPDIANTLSKARTLFDEKNVEVSRGEARLQVIDEKVAGIDEAIRLIGNNHATACTHVKDAANPRCVACGQPITVEASSYIADRTKERDILAGDLQSRKDDKAKLIAESDGLKYDLAAARRELERCKTIVVTLEKNLVDQSQRLSAAKGHVTMTTRYRQYDDEAGRLRATLLKDMSDQETADRRVIELRHGSQDILKRLSHHFDGIVRFFVADGATGMVTLDDDGIHPIVNKGGSLSTAAVDSLKVVAFDLAALILAIEGRTQLPGLLIHDSPREADLGLSIYFRFFELAAKMEALGTAPLFQYIVTTTTAPPTNFQGAQWTKLKLHGAPAEERLFRTNLRAFVVVIDL